MVNIDQKLISLLRRNARASISELATALGVSRATVRARMKYLVDNGEILGFTVVLKGDQSELPVRGISLIEIEGKGKDKIVTRLSGFAEIQAIHSTSGRWDLIVEFATQTLAELNNVLERIRLIDGINTSETSLFLATNRSQKAAAPFPT